MLIKLHKIEFSNFAPSTTVIWPILHHIRSVVRFFRSLWCLVRDLVDSECIYPPLIDFLWSDWTVVGGVPRRFFPGPLSPSVKCSLDDGDVIPYITLVRSQWTRAGRAHSTHSGAHFLHFHFWTSRKQRSASLECANSQTPRGVRIENVLLYTHIQWWRR